MEETDASVDCRWNDLLYVAGAIGVLICLMIMEKTYDKSFVRNYLHINEAENGDGN